MQRVPEPELMREDLQAKAYAEADFEEPHSNFIKLFQQNFPRVNIKGFVLDLGCGPGDISIRFARAFPKCAVHGVDGSEAMLKGAPLVFFVGESLVSQWTLTTTPDIKRVEDLKGKTLGLGRPGSADYSEMVITLGKEFNMQPGKDYKVINA
jgi:SAM-dependent methyltransferase